MPSSDEDIVMPWAAPRKYAEASGLWVCRVVDLVTNPPNLQNLQTSLPGGGFTLPLPPPFRVSKTRHFGRLLARSRRDHSSWVIAHRKH